jgi:predicted nucleic acid-binding protein
VNRILIIDDDAELCALVTRFLSTEGFAIDRAADASQGIELALSGCAPLPAVARSVSLDGVSVTSFFWKCFKAQRDRGLSLLRPTRDEMLARIHSRKRVKLKTSAAVVIQQRTRFVIVVDASAMAEFLLQTPLGIRVEARLLQDDDLHAPHLLDVEVVQAIRRLVNAGSLTAARAAEAIIDLAEFDLIRHPRTDLLNRAWELRAHITAYDAIYVALAEAIDASVITCDGRLSSAPGHTASVEVIR